MPQSARLHWWLDLHNDLRAAGDLTDVRRLASSSTSHAVVSKLQTVGAVIITRIAEGERLQSFTSWTLSSCPRYSGAGRWHAVRTYGEWRNLATAAIRISTCQQRTLYFVPYHMQLVFTPSLTGAATILL